MRASLNLSDVKNAINAFRPLFVSGGRSLQRLRMSLLCEDENSLVLQSFSPEGIMLEKSMSIAAAPDPEQTIVAGEVCLSYFPLVELLNTLRDESIIVEKIDKDTRNLLYIFHKKGNFSVPVYDSSRVDFEISAEVDYDECVAIDLPEGILQAGLNHVRDIMGYYSGKQSGHTGKYSFLCIKDNKVMLSYLSSFALSLAEIETAEPLLSDGQEVYIPLLDKVVECLLLWEANNPVSIYIDSASGRAVFCSGTNKLNYLFPRANMPDIGQVINRKTYDFSVELVAGSVLAAIKRVSVASKRGEISIILASNEEVVLQSSEQQSNRKAELIAEESIQATVNNIDNCPESVKNITVDHNILSRLLTSISGEEIILEYCIEKPVLIIKTKKNKVIKAIGYNS